MVVDTDQLYLDYSLIASWWDECDNVGKVKDNSIMVTDDMKITRTNDDFVIWSCGDMPVAKLWELRYNTYKGKKAPVTLEIIARFTAEQFEKIHGVFLDAVQKSYTSVREDSQIKDVIDEQNSDMAVEALSKKHIDGSTD